MWQDEWKAIAARLHSQIEVGATLMQMFQKNNEDPFGLTNRLTNQIQELNTSLKEFVSRHRNVLPSLARITIESYLGRVQPDWLPGNPMQVLVSKLVNLQLFYSEVQYHLMDFAEIIRRRSERAFLHLQQCIVADSNTKQQWNAAHTDHETSCEKLGAAHLLLHGIYAFKTTATGGRTDLIFNESVQDVAYVASVADALVLTEWKRVTIPSEANDKAEEARKQASIYQSGILSGIELAAYCYIVLVSEDRLKIPDSVEDGMTYRHISIAVSPSTPSVAARK